MLRYIIMRIIYMIPTLFGISIIAFVIIQLPPGDYVTSLIASMSDSGQAFDPTEIARLREIYGFDDPIYVQYYKWISGILLHGDFGVSIATKQPVFREFLNLFPATAELALCAIIIAVRRLQSDEIGGADRAVDADLGAGRHVGVGLQHIAEIRVAQGADRAARFPVRGRFERAGAAGIDFVADLDRRLAFGRSFGDEAQDGIEEIADIVA